MLKYKTDNYPLTRGSELAAGLDICSNEPCGVTLNPGQRHMFHTGIYLSIPRNTYVQVAPRSKLANQHGIDVMAGVIDADYTGEVCVILVNHGDTPTFFPVGSKIAQLIHLPICGGEPQLVDDIAVTGRGSAGIKDTDLRL